MTEEQQYEMQDFIEEYLKKKLEIHVQLDNGQSNGYIDVKVSIVLNGKEIDSGHDQTWIYLEN